MYDHSAKPYKRPRKESNSLERVRWSVNEAVIRRVLGSTREAILFFAMVIAEVGRSVSFNNRIKHCATSYSLFDLANKSPNQ